MNSTEIVYKKESVQQAIKMLTECRTELYDADCIIYEAIIKLINAKGYNLIEHEDSFIDSKMPEKLTTELRNKIKSIIMSITSSTKALEGYMKESTNLETHIGGLQKRSNDGGIGFKAANTITDQSENPTNASPENNQQARKIGITAGIIGASAAGTMMKIDSDEEDEEEEKYIEKIENKREQE